VRKLLEEIGLEGQRIQMINISSAMGGQFAFAAAEMTSEIKQLGPSPLRGEINSVLKAEADATFGDAPDLTRLDPA
jgi:hypothetical protein